MKISAALLGCVVLTGSALALTPAQPGDRATVCEAIRAKAAARPAYQHRRLMTSFIDGPWHRQLEHGEATIKECDKFEKAMALGVDESDPEVPTTADYLKKVLFSFSSDSTKEMLKKTEVKEIDQSEVKRTAVKEQITEKSMTKTSKLIEPQIDDSSVGSDTKDKQLALSKESDVDVAKVKPISATKFYSKDIQRSLKRSSPVLKLPANYEIAAKNTSTGNYTSIGDYNGHYIENTFCCPVATWLWGVAERRAIDAGLAYLRTNGRLCDVGPRSCVRISCSEKSAIYICNDNYFDLQFTCAYVGTYAQQLTDRCGYYAYGMNRVCGQIFDSRHFNIIIHNDFDYC